MAKQAPEAPERRAVLDESKRRLLLSARIDKVAADFGRQKREAHAEYVGRRISQAKYRWLLRRLWIERAEGIARAQRQIEVLLGDKPSEQIIADQERILEAQFEHLAREVQGQCDRGELTATRHESIQRGLRCKKAVAIAGARRDVDILLSLPRVHFEAARESLLREETARAAGIEVASVGGAHIELASARSKLRAGAATRRPKARGPKSKGASTPRPEPQKWDCPKDTWFILGQSKTFLRFKGEEHALAVKADSDTRRMLHCLADRRDRAKSEDINTDFQDRASKTKPYHRVRDANRDLGKKIRSAFGKSLAIPEDIIVGVTGAYRCRIPVKSE